MDRTDVTLCLQTAQIYYSVSIGAQLEIFSTRLALRQLKQGEEIFSRHILLLNCFIFWHSLLQTLVTKTKAFLNQKNNVCYF